MYLNFICGLNKLNLPILLFINGLELNFTKIDTICA